MCTVTWIHESNGYQLFFNRDEKLTRKPAHQPRLEVRDGVRYLAPVDSDFGGTWIGVNEFGLTTCLLNGIASAAPSLRSRGLLLLDLVPAHSTAEVCERLQAADLSPYARFTLAALEPGKPAAVVTWDGSKRTIAFHAEKHFMLTSSSFDTEQVLKRRSDEYRLLEEVTADQLRAFHASHHAGPSAYSVCMHRPDAQTVSFSWIEVAASRIRFFYTPAALCRQAPEVTLEL